ncbi:ribosome small subunit-dependent GTPase A [Agrilactobacillus yilanensis]|uniref:Small ribosomal subunit biogenesis GTPase RsgA n=1 Tax=Agrilactobacillus yilanensis TaxID=2485997 RepID=A0ABW4J7Y2_9LACO|nr:ribosome small subunit-dependent GTPase A [Agrilactobacillus yilanensis]
MITNLKKYGLTTVFEQAAAEFKDLIIARVIAQHRTLYQVMTVDGPRSAVVTGKLAYEAAGQTRFPAVGDWVMVAPTASVSEQMVIHQILPRHSVLARGAAGNGADGQIIAANIDTIFICMSLNADFNLRRMERYLTLAWESSATPVIVLTKADLCEDVSAKIRDLAEVSVGVSVVVCSAVDQSGYESLLTYIQPTETVAFVGSSGVGKSTLINGLLGQTVLETKEIRQDDDKGRHTTTHRQLLPLANGGVVIDTPGMRELQIYVGDLSKTFEDIDSLAQQCKFRDCTHQSEPGCAVKAAIVDGTLSEERLKSYRKLQAEMSYSGLNDRQLEQEKIKRMFGSKAQMTQKMRAVKQRKHR